jgi:hypothetical protein
VSLPGTSLRAEASKEVFLLQELKRDVESTLRKELGENAKLSRSQFEARIAKLVHTHPTCVGTRPLNGHELARVTGHTIGSLLSRFQLVSERDHFHGTPWSELM